MRPFRVIGEREDNETDLPPKQKKESEKKISAPIFGTVVYRLQSVFFAFQHLKEEEEKKKKKRQLLHTKSYTTITGTLSD